MYFDAAKAFLVEDRTPQDLTVVSICRSLRISDLSLQERCLQIRVLNLLHSSAHLTHSMQVRGHLPRAIMFADLFCLASWSVPASCTAFGWSCEHPCMRMTCCPRCSTVLPLLLTQAVPLMWSLLLVAAALLLPA